MQIRSQQILAALASTVAVALVATILLHSAGRMSLAIKRANFAASIITDGVSGLRLVTMEYALYGHARSRQQWHERHATLARLLASDIIEGTEEQSILAGIRARHQYIGELFTRLEAMKDDGPAARIAPPLRAELEKRLLTQIMVATQDMVVGAARLARASHEQLERTERNTGYLVMGLVALVGLIVLTNLILSVHQILNPLKRLMLGTQRLARGDLEYRTGIEADTEIGALSRAFDQMAISLAGARADQASSTARLLMSNRELESFSYSVAHDLRAPLRGIDGWSLALKEDHGGQLNEKAREQLELIRAEAQRMARLIDDLLLLARVARAPIKRAPLDLSALAHAVAGRLKQSQPGRAIEFHIQPGLAATCDSNLLEIALGNLFDNALKFTTPHAAALIAFGGTIEPDAQTGAPQAVYFVRDNGVGFDRAHAGKLFGAFQRLHKTSEFPGNGIGLATVQRIVQLHDGRIWAEAGVHQGATFFFTLGEAA